ncbi:MAG: serine hydrolase domain-containing protein, partial [Actinomycetes bacterium]
MFNGRTATATTSLALAAALLVGLPPTARASGPFTTDPPVQDRATDYSSVVQTLRTEIPKMLSDAGIVGATVALTDGDRTVMAEGFGWADRAKRRSVTNRTLFHIGSLSKTFAALSVMQLVERGKVKLNAPITRYVPQLRLLPRFRNNTITVRSVLDHHSGIPGDLFYGLITMKHPDRGFRNWLYRALSAMPPERRVNTEWAYNNSGFVLLQALVENVTGQPYASWTGRNLFSRMKMRSSSFDDTKASSSAMTRNYSPVIGPDGRPTGSTKADPREYVNGWTAGSILSSAADMTNYLKMLTHRGAGVGSRVVQAKTLAQMTTPQTDLPIDEFVRIGLSFFVSDTWMGRTFGHDGATTRNFSMMTIHPGQQLGVFVSTNTVGGSAVADAIATRAMALSYTAKTGIVEPAPTPLPNPGPGTPSDTELASATGRYAGYTDYRDVSVQGTQLLLTKHASGQAESSALSRLADGWWKIEGNDSAQVAFQTVAGKRIIVARYGTSAGIQRGTMGQKMAQATPSA